MKRFSDIVSGLEVSWSQRGKDQELRGISLDSRQIREGFLFVARRGAQMDGHAYAKSACDAGAQFILCEYVPEGLPSHVSIVQAEDVTQVLAQICKRYFGDPSESMHIIGVTGTNGKSTVVYGLYSGFKALGIPVGMLSTFGNRWADIQLDAQLTTPDVVSLYRMLKEMRRAGIRYVCMEVSSHALDQGRVAGIDFFAAVFTNLSRDHLDYHGTMSAYRDAKKMLFDGLSPEAHAIVNVDDKNGEFMIQNCRAEIHRYSGRRQADIRVKLLEQSTSGNLVQLNDVELHSLLIGDFNAYNLASIYGVLRLVQEDESEVLRALSVIQAPPGRLELIPNDKGILALVDYAHTPDAVAKILKTLNGIRVGEARILTVIGCGGDRDKTKRPQMALEAVRGSEIVVLTSDNPRTEDPETILADMIAGLQDPQEMKGVHVEIDRSEAIKLAARLARKGDIILVAGKGHETYQIIGKEKIDFDDREKLKGALRTSSKI